MFQCLSCENWVHESCTTLRPSKAIDDLHSAKRDLADGPLIDHESFELFLCHECVCKQDLLQSYAGHRGWIICVPTREDLYLPDLIDSVPAINVEAKGANWSHPWKVYGLDQGVSQDPGLLAEAVSETGLKRKAGATLSSDQLEQRQIGENSASKRVKSENGLEVLDTFSQTSQTSKDGPDQAVVQDADDVVCTAGDRPLFLNASSSQAIRSDIFLAVGFRDRICRCKMVRITFDRSALTSANTIPLSSVRSTSSQISVVMGSRRDVFASSISS